jgi:hypothetical protein
LERQAYPLELFGSTHETLVQIEDIVGQYHCGCLATLEASTGLLQPYLPDHWYVAVAVGLPIINVVLRIITTQGLKA